MTNLLVGVDGSDESHRAAYFARDLARQFGAKLTLLYVVEPLPNATAGALDERHETYYERQVRGAASLLRDLSEELEVGTVDQVVEMGRAGDVICREGEERNADLIIVGSHGQSAGARFLMGSVVDRVATLASRSVAIVR
jgi:nucleotide-binding universal stress UspA family protein